MATPRKSRAKATPTTEEPALEIVPDAAEEEVEPEAPQAVIVFKITDDSGNISTDVQPINGLQPTEVQTILELGVGSWRAKIGLDRAT